MSKKEQEPKLEVVHNATQEVQEDDWKLEYPISHPKMYAL